MTYALTIEADDPCHVAHVIAQFWDGRAFPIAPAEGAWIAQAPDQRHAAISVHPRDGTEHGDAASEASGPAAIDADLPADCVMAIARRERWPAEYRAQGGVITLWIEGSQKVEILIPRKRRRVSAAGSEIEALRRGTRAGRRAPRPTRG
jgi:hypothetical protein